MPAILPRAGFTLIESHVAHFMKKYGLTSAMFLTDGRRVRAGLAAGSLPRGFTIKDIAMRAPCCGSP